MKDLTVARRYAVAVFQLAEERNQVERVQADLAQVIQTIAASADLRKLVADQRVPAHGKKEVFRQVFAGAVSVITMNFLLLVLDKGREAHLEAIYQQYTARVRHRQNIQEAEVRTAMPLGADTLSALADRLGQSTGGQVVLTTKVDPSLLGGMVLKIGDRVYDGSVATRLKTLQNRLCQADF